MNNKYIIVVVCGCGGSTGTTDQLQSVCGLGCVPFKGPKTMPLANLSFIFWSSRLDLEAPNNINWQMWRSRETMVATAMVTQRCVGSRQVQPQYRMMLSSSSSSSTASTTTSSSRKRHRFRTADELPTFKEFQLQFQWRSLYRKYLRLSYHHHKNSNDDDLRRQIRAEFRRSPTTTTSRLDDRAISEANRRYKELQNVLQAATTSTTTTNRGQSSLSSSSTTPPPPTNKDWPWNKRRNTQPKVFPPKSGL
jgi:Complex 1 protein (LYR family)